jgi:hypothetical protein
MLIPVDFGGSYYASSQIKVANRSHVNNLFRMSVVHATSAIAVQCLQSAAAVLSAGAHGNGAAGETGGPGWLPACYKAILCGVCAFNLTVKSRKLTQKSSS